ncbi:MAG: RNA methyltransferase [Bacteroidales bacterium]|nr:RNA methyltransferase [Bacteroidales bacterium]
MVSKDMFSQYTTAEKQQMYDALGEFYSERRKQLFDQLVRNRTRHICVMVEDIYQSHNASAVLRSCDCFGVQDIHVVERHNRFNPNSEVAMGSDKWLDVFKYKHTLEAYDTLRRQGYQIIATTPHENDMMIDAIDITRPTVLVFGTELTGLTQEAIDHADGYAKIPMYGFTESYNISVSAALSLFSVTERMRKDPQLHWQLSNDEQLELKLRWSIQTIKEGEQVLKNIAERLFGATH